MYKQLQRYKAQQNIQLIFPENGMSLQRFIQVHPSIIGQDNVALIVFMELSMEQVVSSIQILSPVKIPLFPPTRTKNMNPMFFTTPMRLTTMQPVS